MKFIFASQPHEHLRYVFSVLEWGTALRSTCIMRLGDAMALLEIGAIFSAERRNLAHAHGRMLFANSDLSGFSIFEEAQYRGAYAEDRVLR
jgi:hypothetical protein